MGNKKATGFLCLRLVPCFAYVGAEDNRKGIPFVKIVSLLCKLIQFLMVALSVTVHKALILLVFLNHPYQSLALNRFVEFYIGREDVQNTKPDPEIYNAILKIKKGKPLFVVEDSEFGIKSAKMAGLKVVAFNSKIYSLNQKESDYIVTNHNQIICLI